MKKLFYTSTENFRNSKRKECVQHEIQNDSLGFGWNFNKLSEDHYT